MDWQSFFTTLGLSSVAFAAFTFLAKKIVEQVLSKDIASFQANLNAEHQIAIEKLRHELRTDALEREVRFSRLYEKRLEVLGELYSRMKKAEAAFANYTHPFQLGGDKEHEKRGELAGQCGNKFFQYFNKNEVYLDDGLASQVNQM